MSHRRLAAILAIDVVGYSKMMEHKPSDALTALNLVFRTIVQPCVNEAEGRVVKLLGDGAIVEFPSAHSALVCAVTIQERMRLPNAQHNLKQPVYLRMGLHAGDVLSEDDDIFGDAVNIAARLQAESEAGGVLLSQTVAELAGGDLPFRLRGEGLRTLKNLSSPVDTMSVDFANEEITVERARIAESLAVRFCKSKDGQTLAWADVGEGPPIVRAPSWISHLELVWRDPGLAHWLHSFSVGHRLVCFDARGNGLSDWQLGSISFDSLVDDLESVFDAAGVDRAPVLANSQGCAIAAAFAARAPERVSAIVMLGGFALGRAKRSSEKDRTRAKALQAMMAAGWDDEHPSLRDLLAETIVPLASADAKRRYAEDMREMISPENIGLYREVVDNIDVMSILPDVLAPCVVIHCKGDRMQPIDQGRQLAANIPNAKFIALESSNHNLTKNDPCWPLAEREIHAFLEAHA